MEDPNIVFVRNELESKLGLNVEIINKKKHDAYGDPKKGAKVMYAMMDKFERMA